MEVKPALERTFIGKDNETYTILGFKDTSLTGLQKDSILKEVIKLQIAVFDWRDPNLITARIKHHSELPNLGIELLKLGDRDGPSVGYTLLSSIKPEYRHSEPEYFLQTPRKQILNCMRGVLPGFERKGGGSEMLRIAIRGLYPNSDFILFMTQSASSVLSTWPIEEIIDPYPFGRKLDMDQPLRTYDQDPEMQWFLGQGYYQYKYPDSYEFSSFTGRSKGDLKKIGVNYRTFIPDKYNYWEWVIVRKMVLDFPEGLGMNRERGDEAWVMSRLKTDLAETTGKIPSVA